MHSQPVFLLVLRAGLDATIDLKNGTRITAKIKINLSLIDADFEALMKDVSNDVSRLDCSVQTPAGIPELIGLAWTFT